MTKSILTRDYRIRYSEIGADGRLKIGAVLDYLQDAAGDHAALLGVSWTDLFARNMGWVIRQYRLEVNCYPKGNDVITLHTWRHTYRRLYELREFDVRDKAGNQLMQAQSCWILINLETRKPLRIDRNLPVLNEKGDREIAWTFSEPEPVVRADHEVAFLVRRHDLDINRHANNAVFIQWAVDAVDPQTADSHRPYRVDALFASEALEGDRVLSRLQKVADTADITFRHGIVHADTGLELARVKSIWRS